MVERRVSDGVRIAQLLSSELDGREDGALDRLAVTSADRSVEASPEGERAYDVERAGEAFARAFVHEDRVRLELKNGGEAVADRVAGDGLRASVGDEGTGELLVESGAAVKRAVDALEGAAIDLEENRSS
ncbi:hypothetical protein [Natronoarchaeum rubrum]|uniref:hypothetical protein n=1 Tax=Natronoarchaeum rubrum TaxID=755311 RepID=UPI002111BA4C|nr:hypothetical protein [Natronoarchaeum rubrum]